MPEGPEVYVVRAALAKSGAVGRTVEVEGRFTEALRSPIPDLSPIRNQKLIRVVRKGKILGFDFGSHVLVSHLGMTGMWHIIDGKRVPDRTVLKHQHVLLRFPGPNRKSDIRFVYTDPRRFGQILLLTPPEVTTLLSKLGFDPMTVHDPRVMMDALKAVTPSWTIKQFLMDPHKVLGIGNIYASEILNRCGIHPEEPAVNCVAQAKKLLSMSQTVLAMAVNMGGSSIHSYVDPRGRSGRMQTAYVAYNRDGAKCQMCGQDHISKGTFKDGRSSYWCPSCQVLSEDK